jgi:hypothetical protein
MLQVLQAPMARRRGQSGRGGGNQVANCSEGLRHAAVLLGAARLRRFPFLAPVSKPRNQATLGLRRRASAWDRQIDTQVRFRLARA